MDIRQILSLALIVLLGCDQISIGDSRPYVPIGHLDGIIDVAFNNDAELLVSGGADQLVKLWNVSTGKEIRTFAGHDGFVYSVAISSDASLIASAGSDMTLRIWDSRSGNQLHSFAPIPEPNTKIRFNRIENLAFSPDNRLVAATSWDFGGRVVTIWDIESGTEFKRLSDNPGKVQRIAFSSDCSMLACLCEYSTIVVWSVVDVHSRCGDGQIRLQEETMTGFDFFHDLDDDDEEWPEETDTWEVWGKF
ncbi:MAG: hypothetical protein KKG33_06930 [candidate division Zixibacteria bacterium]|nr:hypothetical protein [candidate division Zixibacteria bacterium]MBU2625276.1 hypothetical protein [candidate division Zixibacteria bacterium]